ncbi:MAG: hypothetical protein QOJ42_533, partial [Acidobacteriaceae bacterium]|nr:hypothetical protein [Acidobacteriaceae bacterium]
MPPRTAHPLFSLRSVCRAAVLLVAVAMSTVVPAQETTGTILGSVTDPSGATVPNARITITNTDRNTQERVLTSNSAGDYSAPQLPIGHYSIRVEAPGFKNYQESSITLNVNDRRAIPVRLDVGNVQETVSVQANALQVDTQSAAATGLITGTQIRELALQSRNYEELVALMPGVSSDIGDALFAGVSAPGGNTNETAFSLNGSFGSQNNWSIDGADNVDRGGNFSLLNYPSVDAISEFKVLRGNYNAEYGRSAGGQINVITRSGTAKFHGGLYEFFRNDVLDANDWGNKQQDPVAPRTPFRYNDFGGTIGGPLFIPKVYNTDKKKTFFFFSEEVRRVVQSSPVTGVAPNLQERGGSIGGGGDAVFANPVCDAYPNGDGSCPGNLITTIPTSRINSAAAAYLKDVYSHVPLPQDPTNDQLFSNQANIFNYRQEIVRVDHTFSPKLSGFIRYIQDSIPTVEGGGLFNGNPLPNITQTNTQSPGKNVVANLSMTFSPTFLNEVEYAWSYGAVLSVNSGQLAATNSPDVASAIQLPFPETLNRIPSIAFGAPNASFFGFGSYNDYNKNQTIFDNVTKITGKHTLKFGFSFDHYFKSENSGGNNAGTFAFQATPATGATEFQQEFALFLLGQSTNFTQNTIDIRALIHQNMLELFGQDEYRLFPNLTLSYGLRYSLFRQPTDGGGHATSFDTARYNPANAPVIDNSGNICTPATMPCDGTAQTNPGFDPLNGIIIGGKNSPFGNAVASQPNYGLQPRIGFAYDPTNDNKTSIRGGYGLFLEAPGVGFVENNVFINPPFVGGTTINNAPFSNPNGGAASNNSVQSLGGTASNWHQPYTQQYNLDVQHEFGYNIIGDIGYYGSKGTHQLSQVDINQPLPGAYATSPLIQNNPNYVPNPDGTPSQLTASEEGLLNLIRPYQGYGPIDVFQPRFTSNYNSLQASLQKRFGAGSLVGINYTYSKSLTNRPDEVGGSLPVPQNTYDLNAEYGPSRFDRRHVFNANFVYELPFFAQQQGFVGRSLGGWEFSGIIEAQSGHAISAVGNQAVDPGGL